MGGWSADGEWMADEWRLVNVWVGRRRLLGGGRSAEGGGIERNTPLESRTGAKKDVAIKWVKDKSAGASAFIHALKLAREL